MEILKYQQTMPKKTEEEKREEDKNFKAPPLKVYQIPVRSFLRLIVQL